jgi:hypothetical protein
MILPVLNIENNLLNAFASSRAGKMSVYGMFIYTQKGEKRGGEGM